MTPTDIAMAFSTGKFTTALPYVADNAIWEIVGEKTLAGKAAIAAYCEAVASYFASVETLFTTASCIVSQNQIAISGKAVFSKNGEIKQTIQACDIYVFENNQLLQIVSYCIAQNK